ncbi:MAG: hypothetical protein KIT84_06385 [Labilithrix sp.]|nr:hypothetical protein [Labilithrix sp.]MCW5810620.1 hypothetical protein [Labilithrix sp.]
MKRMSWMLGAVVVGVVALTGCSSSEPENTSSSSQRLTVQGSVSSRLGTDNARAVAVDKNGKKIWTYLDKKGDFTLKLPIGKSYRVLIANQLPGGGQKVIGKLSLKNGATKTSWMNTKDGGKVNLGTLVKPSTEKPGGAVEPKCFCDDDWGGKDKDKGGWDDDDWGGSKSKGNGGGKDGWDDDDWDDGDWGGGGWEDDDDWGDDDDWDDSDHDDDNECFGDDDDDDDDWGGKHDLDEDELCDVCTDGGFVELEPSKKDAGNWGDVDADDADFPESKACPKKADVEDEEPSLEPSSEEVQSKKPGDKCSVKNECGDSVCIASKCSAK